jgi:hypothetical protein
MDIGKSLAHFGLQSTDQLTIEGFEKLKGLAATHQQRLKEAKVATAGKAKAN